MRITEALLLTLVSIASCDNNVIEVDAGTDLFTDPEYDQLSWFVHVTDIHISSWEDETRQTQLSQFVEESLAVIKPELVMCGGDLTESKPSNLEADQDEREWSRYRDIVDTRWTRGNARVAWLDIRGNHDTLNVLGRHSERNYFSNYSVMGRLGMLNSYKVKLQSRGQKFNIIAVDATWEMGMNYPFNFIGYLDERERQTLDDLVKDLDDDELNIFFGHYPTSTVQQSDYLRQLVSHHGHVYLSGHLHDLAVFHEHHLYSFHDQDSLELELVDWKNNRMFRLLALDQGRLSFTDVRFNEWPVVLITNPKDAQFTMPDKEKYSETNNLIRVLVFHREDVIERVTIALDDEDEYEASRVGDGPLYTLAWDVDKYKTGVHKMRVRVMDTNNNEKIVIQDFTLDNSESHQFSRFFPNFVLRSSFSSVFNIFYSLTIIFNLLIPAVLKTLVYASQTSRLTPAQRLMLKKLCGCSLMRKMILVVCHQTIFISLLVFIIYMSVGPWIVGSLIEGHVGAVFSWGILINNTMLHAQVPKIYYFLHFGLIHPVLVFAIGHILDYRHNTLLGSYQNTVIGHSLTSVLSVAVIAFSALLSVTFWLQFGVLGFIFGPLKTWSYLFYTVMMILAWRSPADTFSRYNRAICDQNKKQEDVETQNSEDQALLNTPNTPVSVLAS